MNQGRYKDCRLDFTIVFVTRLEFIIHSIADLPFGNTCIDQGITVVKYAEVSSAYTGTIIAVNTDINSYRTLFTPNNPTAFIINPQL